MARKKKAELVNETEATVIVEDAAPPKQEQIIPRQPNPVEHFDGYSVEWFKYEKDAMSFHRSVRERGDTYKAGKLAGMSCGRDENLDRDGMFAVTFSK